MPALRLGTIGNAARRDPLRPDRRPGRQQRRPAALRQLPVRAVPRHERAECLPGEMTRRGGPPVAAGVGERRRPMPPHVIPRPPRGSACSRRAGARARGMTPQPSRALPTSAEPPPTPLRGGPDRGPPPPGHPQHELPDPVSQDNPGAIRAPPPEAFPADQIPVPDRWRLIETLGLVRERWFDPYNQNTYKGDRPICIPTDGGAGAAPRGRPRRAARTPRFLGLDERRLVLRRQRRLRHGDRAAHLPDPGRRPDHRSGPAATTCSASNRQPRPRRRPSSPASP